MFTSIEVDADFGLCDKVCADVFEDIFWGNVTAERHLVDCYRGPVQSTVLLPCLCIVSQNRIICRLLVLAQKALSYTLLSLFPGHFKSFMRVLRTLPGYEPEAH